MRFKWILLTALLILSGCREASEQDSAASTDLPWVKTFEVDVADPMPLRLSGTLRGRYEIPQAFQVAGRLQQRYVDAGQRVAEGDLLFKLDKRDLLAAAAVAAAGVKSAEAALAIAKSELERQQQLVERKFVSQQTLQRFELAVREALSQKETAAALNQQAQNALSYTELRAAKAGVMTEVKVEPGQVVAIGQVLAILVEDALLDVEVFLPEGEAPAQTGELLLSSGEKLELSLREIAGAADSSSRSWRARYSLQAPYPSSLTLGSVVSVRLASPQAVSSLRVPLGALDERGQTPQIWVFAQGQVQPLAVEVLALEAEHARIQAELPVGTRIVALGTHLLTPGMQVRELAP